MDTIYSQYDRWKAHPGKVEKQWLTAYQNLLRLQNLMGDKLVIVRYEDMVVSLSCLEPVFRFCGVEASTADNTYLHQKSLHKWKRDSWFGFSLSNETIALAEKYGYEKEDVVNHDRILWPVVRTLSRAAYQITKPLKNLAQRMLRIAMPNLKS